MYTACTTYTTFIAAERAVHDYGVHRKPNTWDDENVI